MAETIELADATRDLDESASGLVVAGTYRLLERLGTGGMADVYEAEHIRLGNRVAVKLLRTNGRADRRGVDRFQHESRRVAALVSEHVVKVFDCGELPNGTPYLVMERLWGEDLKSLLAREGRLPIRRAVELAVGACRGLSVVHAAGLVHRNLKPANLFVARGFGGNDWCKILDFGVAKALVSDATAGGGLLGTVRYMAPEQLEDAASARATADIYALGAILFECLTGAPPHRGETLQELMFDIVHRNVAPPSTLRPLPSELEAIVLKALSREKSKRFSTVEQMALALAPFGAVAPPERRIEGIDDATLADEVVPGMARPAASRSRSNVIWLFGALGVTLAAVGLVHGRVQLEPKPATTAGARPAPAPTVTAVTAPVEAPEPAVYVPTAASGNAGALRAEHPLAPPPTKPTARRNKPPAETRDPAPTDQGRFDSKDPYSE